MLPGGLGFIGCTLVTQLLKKYQDTNIIIIDKFTYASNRIFYNEIKNHSRVTVWQIDINNNDLIAKLFKTYKPIGVFHLAAESHVDNSISNPSEFIYSNIIGTYNLLEQIRTYLTNNPDFKNNFKFLYISTDEVYGDLTLQEQKFTELSNYKPSSPYSASKACGDHLVKAWFRTYGLPTLITHCSNNYGPYQHEEKLIPKTIKNILNQKPIPVYGTGMNIRDWIYVEDHANALITVFEQGILGQTYNIGSNCEKTNIQIINTICEILQKKMNLIYDPKTLIQFITDRPGHDKRYAINNSKIKELGWKHETSYKKGLQKTIDWYIKNNIKEN